MRYLSVCSGIEAATQAWHPLGWEPLAFSEIERFPAEVLAHHYPDVPNLGDMTRYREWDIACSCDPGREQRGPEAVGRRLEGRRNHVHTEHAGSSHDRRDGGSACVRCGKPDVDVLVGGTPCQSFSVAGLRKGLDDPRGNLALVYLGIADRLRPRWLVWENVPGVLSSNGGRDFGAFLGGLEQLGYGWSYRTLDAQYVRVESHPRAVPQRRRRVFVVGHIGDWRRAAAVLLERESMSGSPKPRRGLRKKTTEALEGCSGRNGESGIVKRTTYPVGPTIGNSGTPYSRTGNARVEHEALVVETVPEYYSHAYSQDRVYSPKGVSPAINCSQKHTFLTGNRVRRITPRECERLQGFPDDFTRIPWRGKDPEDCPDGHRYRALGNSMAVNVMRWIGERIAVVDDI